MTDTDISGFDNLFQWHIYLHEKDETTWTSGNAADLGNADVILTDHYRASQPMNASYSMKTNSLIHSIEYRNSSF